MILKKQSFFCGLLIILIVSQLLGLYGAPFYATRILALFFFPFCFLTFKFPYSNRILILLWIVYFFSAIIFMVSPYIDLKINHLVYMGVNLIIFCEVIYFSQEILDIHKVVWKGWMFFILLSLPVALVEVIFNYHLPISFFDADYFDGGVGVSRRFSSVTFGNYNQYMVLLCFGETFILSGLLRTDSWFKRKKKEIIIVSAIVLLIVGINASRGALLYLLICYFLVFYFLLKQNNKSIGFRIKSFFGVFFIINVMIMVIMQTSVFDNILYRLSAVGYTDNSRKILRESGLDMFVDSYFLGVGPGNFLEKMVFYSNTIKMPAHNMFIELLSEYGILFSIIVFIVIYDILKNLRQKNNLLYRFLFYSFLACNLVVYNINSTYTHGVYVWIFMASMYSVAKVNKYEKYEN